MCVAQRFCAQHQVKLGKLENIFLTQLHADTLGGLLGMYLTLADSGSRGLSIHGPPGVSHFLSAGKGFCENRPDSELRAAEINLEYPTDSLLNDKFLSIQPIPAAAHCQPPAASCSSEAAGAKIERNLRRGVSGLYCETAVSYVLRFADEAGKLDVDKALALGVPKGKMLGELKGGHAITLPDGRVVEPSECVEHAKLGSQIVLLACPSLHHVVPLATSPLWNTLPPPPTKSPVAQGQGSGEVGGGGGGGLQAEMVVHFGEREVLCDQRYVALVRRISKPNACHILLHASVCVPEADILESQHDMCGMAGIYGVWLVYGWCMAGAFSSRPCVVWLVSFQRKCARTLMCC